MTQPQREALLDLLIIGILVDSKLSAAEDAALEEAFKSIGWEGSKPREVFLCSSMHRARWARDSDAALANYINSRARAFTDGDSRNMVFDLLRRVFMADGLAPSEAAFLVQLEAGFRNSPGWNASACTDGGRAVPVSG